MSRIRDGRLVPEHKVRGRNCRMIRRLARLAGGVSARHRAPVMGSRQEVCRCDRDTLGCLLPGGSAAYLRLLTHSATALACSSFSPGMPLLCGALLPDSPLVRCSAI